jgi:RNA-binding protein
MDDALRTRELVKVDISRNLDVKPKEAANALATATGAEVIQVIGRKATLYRENPDLDWKGDIPPWR